MKCRYCGAEMRLDDVDFNFKGNKDNYWICDVLECYASCIEEIRYGKPITQIWHKETGDSIVNENIKM